MSYYRDKFRMYRRREGRICCGVAGGIADHFDISPWIVRGIFVVLACVNAAFIALYCLLCILMKSSPYKPFRDFQDEELFNSYQTSREDVMDRMRRTYDSLDKRLQGLESIVTKPSFDVEEEIRKL